MNSRVKDYNGAYQGASAEFDSIEAFNNALPDWDLRFRQEQAGSIAIQAKIVAGPGLAANRISINKRIAQGGASPRGVRTFGLLGQNSGEYSWCGRTISAGTLEEFDPESEFTCFSDGQFAVQTLSIAESLLAQRAEAMQLSLGSAGFHIFQPPAELLRALRGYAGWLFNAVEAEPAPASTVEGIRADLECLLIEAIGGGGPGGQLNHNSRAAARYLALEYLHSHDQQPISVGDLCASIGTSWRQLDYAFKEQFGIGPKAYHKQLRLRGLRKSLLSAESGESISQIATTWGFTHFGQLSRDYKKLFGDTPADDRKRHNAAHYL